MLSRSLKQSRMARQKKKEKKKIIAVKTRVTRPNSLQLKPSSHLKDQMKKYLLNTTTLFR